MRFISATTILLFLLSPLGAFADYIEPGDVSVKTKRYTPEKTDFSAGSYTYKIKWQGMSVAEAHVEVDNSASSQYNVTAKAETEGMVSVFYKMRHKSNSVFDAQSLRPVKFETYQKERRREKKRQVSFNSDGTIRFTSSKNGEVRSKKSFRSQNQTLDPISAAFFARSLPIKLGTTASFDVFNGKHRYLITCKVDKREKISIAGRMVDAYRVIPTVEKLTDSEADSRLESAKIWISADSARHVLRIQSKVWVGSVSAELSDFTPVRSTAIGQYAQATPSSRVR